MNCEKRICVIGCGIAGLCAIRVFSEDIKAFPFNCSITGYERKDVLGGIWNYDEEISGELVSPIYRNLKSNLPKELMEFPDMPYSSDIKESFIGHKDVLSYLQNYAKHYGLEKFIEYNSDITSLDLIKTDDLVKWKLQIRNSKSLITIEEIFDVVLLCNGHFEKPNIPIIKGIENFRGECIHSKYYRYPEKYSNKTVFVVGARSSGLDITCQLLDVAHKVYLSHSNKPLNCRLGNSNVEEVAQISHIDCDGKLILVNGLQYEADAIIFCTGYEVNLNFLGDSVPLKFDNSYIRPLYKDLISPYFPSSCFIIGLGYEYMPFIHCYMQSKVVRAVVQNCCRDIPMCTEMLLEEFQKEEENFEINRVPLRHRHYLGDKQWPYLQWCQHVAANIMTAKIPRYYESMFRMVSKVRFTYVKQYRDIVLKLVDNSKFGFVIEDGPHNGFFSEEPESWFGDFTQII